MKNRQFEHKDVVTLVDLVRWRAQQQPDEVLYTFLRHDNTEAETLTFAELDQRARMIGALLQELGLAGERALLLYPPGMDYIAAFFGCLYAGVIAVPAYPPQPNRPALRIQAIVADARAAVALTTTALLTNIEQRFASTPDLERLRWLATDTALPAQAGQWRVPAISAEQLAFLQYTSGSTAAPKGVMLSHRTLLHNSQLIRDGFNHSADSRGVIWLPPYHDMGLIGGIIQPLYSGFLVTLMSPVSFLQRPFRWLEAISRYGGTTSGGPNFAYELCINKITPEQRATLDLSSWRVAFTGAEPIRQETLERFTATFAPSGFRQEMFYPCYGLAEATLIVTGSAPSRPPVFHALESEALTQHRVAVAEAADRSAQVLVGCGTALDSQQVLIVDPETRLRCAPDQVGEIWVRGPSVAQGYWEQRERTADSFQARLTDTDDGPFLRTGDLGFLRDGELYVTGRLKDLIIIRGRNHYPQDIELTVEASHPAVRPGSGAAFAIEGDSTEQLVIAQEIERRYLKADLAPIIQAIRQSVQLQHEVPVAAVVLLKPGAIPKTSSGKIQRHACRRGYLDGSLAAVSQDLLADAPAQPPMLKLIRAELLALPPDQRATLLATQLRQDVGQMLRIDPERLSLAQPLIGLGLDSLQAVELTNRIEADLQVVVPMTSVLQGSSLAELSGEVVEQLSQAEPVETALMAGTAPSAAAPLTYGQRALWFLHRLSPDSAAYNIASAARAETLDVAALEAALLALVERHPMLRATFPMVQGEPVQMIQPTGGLALAQIDAAAWSAAALQQQLVAEAHRPFDIQHGPLLRVTLYTHDDQPTVILLVVHHIVVDFWSLAILIDELGQLYNGLVAGQPAALTPLELNYIDYGRWQSELLAGASSERLWSFWQRQLADASPVLELPTDRPRPHVQSYRGASQVARLSPGLSQQIKDFSETRGLTLYMTLLTAWEALLYRYSGQAEFLLGTTTAGRTRSRLANLVGYFVNPIVLRADLRENPPVSTLLDQVRCTVLDAFMHAELPFPLLVERLQPERDPSRSPLFQVLFTLQQTPRLADQGLASFALGQSEATLSLDQLTLEVIGLEQHAAQFDLTMMLADTPRGLAAALQYNSDLFEASTIQRMLDHFEIILAAIVARPDQRIADLPLLSDAEQQQRRDWNATEAEYPRQTCLHELISEQAQRRPDATAVLFAPVDGPTQVALSYRDLDQRANQLAHHLRACGIGSSADREMRVGLYIERAPEMLVGLLGVLKAGAAYVPLDPAYPPERVRYVLEDAGISLLLTQERLLPQLSGQPTPTLCLDADWLVVAQQPTTAPVSAVTPDHLAYVIYTSGSTGKPKGVQIPHRALVNFLCSMGREPGLTERDTLLSVTTLSFDIAGLELFLPLVAGAAVLLVPRETAVNGSRLRAHLADDGVTMMQATPTTWRLLLEAGWVGTPALTMLCGGEAFPPDLARQLQPLGRALWNMYGPTETTIWSLVQPVVEVAGSVPVGRPIANTQTHILDARLEPVPVGVPGDLYIGGDGLARGYFNRPALTAARFLANPFSHPGGARPGARMYQTGDRARYLPDGTVEYLGRDDQQIKLRGFRIELGEIEAVLQQHAAVKSAAVALKPLPQRPNEQQVVAYVVGEERVPSGQTENQEPGDTTDGSQFSVLGSELASELRGFLKERLPAYMLPTAFVFLPALPLTPNGKLDRKALPQPAAPQQRRSSPALGSSTVERAITDAWRAALGLEQIDPDDTFFDLGGHSLLVAQVHSRLTEQHGFDLSLTDLFKYPTINTLAAHLSQRQPEATVPRAGRAQARRDALEQRSPEIAIIGMDGRFPGAATIDAFWANLRDGVESIAFFSEQQVLAAGVDPAQARDPRYVRARGVLDGVDQFDAAFFGFNPREAQMMDPQHRVFLECAWHALEYAGYDPEQYPDRIAVYAGVGLNTYLLHVSRAALEAGGRYQAFIGNDKDFVPTRVSYKLGLRGPSVNVQTACSTSLVAVHLACQSLLLGEADMALAGGVAINVPHQAGYLYEEGGIASPDGHCRAFDASAQGTVFGSGVGIVVLKRLQAALRDGDTIHAVIKGSAINNDGALKVGYTAPSVEGQAEVIAEALAIAGVAPETVSYIEAHGTGTALGDPIEVAALTEAFRASTDQQGFCALGSVKTNVGHLDTAAGIAGLIKTVQALKYAQIPPTLHYQSPNSKIDFAGSPFFVNDTLRPWPRGDAPRRAGVSSFGIGGTNAHLVLEEAPRPAPRPAAAPAWQLLPLSARSASALDRLTTALAAQLQQQPDLDLADVAYTLQTGRRAFAHRRFLVCQDRQQALAALQLVDSEQVPAAARGKPEVAFLFPGQGAQYAGMGRELYETEPVFHATVDQCCALLLPHLGLDLRRVLFPPPAEHAAATAQLTATALAQPALFVIAYATAQLWQHWGLRPAALLGHSLGEYVAATLAGVFHLEDALALVAARGRLMQRMPSGVMLAVPLPEAELRPLLGADLDLAAVNGPAQCVVSGPSAAIDALERRLADQEVLCRRLHTSHAFHSAMLDPILTEFAAVVGRVALQPPTLPVVSNVSGTWLNAADATDPQYWTRQLRAPVRFADGLATLRSAGDQVLLEVGPGTTLNSLVRAQPDAPLTLASLPHPQDARPASAFVRATLGQLWQHGVSVTWSQLHAGSPRQRVPLPTYPFERQRHWIDAAEPIASQRQQARPSGKQASLSDWLYVPLWKQSVPPLATATAPAQRWLLFNDRCGVALELARRLQQQGQQVVLVEHGHGFSQRDDRLYSIDASQPTDYDTLLSELRAADFEPQQIVHAWSVTPDDVTLSDLDAAQDACFYSLLFLAQALDRQQLRSGLRLSILSNNMQWLGGELLHQPEKATLLGPCRVIPQEYPHLICRSIDLVLAPASSSAAHEQLDLLLDELTGDGSAPVLAYRGGQRWVQTFEPMPLAQGAGLPARLRERGVYLITGGLGGIGLALAAYLARTVRARLVLVGRRGLPPRSEWTQLAAVGDAQQQARIRQVQALEAQGAEVLVLSAEATTLDQMQAVVAQAQAHFGPIEGVIHAAGVAGGGLVQLKAPAAAGAVLAPKVQGTLVLKQALAEMPLQFFVLCSSINAVVGGFGQIDYCAANAFMDAFAASHASRSGPLYLSINWDRWQEVGMAVDTAVPASFRALQDGLGSTPLDHPLLQSCISATAEQAIYRSIFTVDQQWVLSEHRIVGRATVPGTTYLEMVRAAFHRYAEGQPVEISDVVFITPLAVADDERKEVLTILEQQADGYGFRVISRVEGSAEADWHEHARGSVRAAAAPQPAPLELMAVAQRMGPARVVSADSAIRQDETFLLVGPRWSALTQVHQGAAEGLAQMRLDDQFCADLERLPLHPALLDVATGSIQRLGLGNYLPLTYERLRIYQPLTPTVYSHVVYKHAAESSKQLLTCDIRLVDEWGICLVEITNFSMKHVDDEARAALKALFDSDRAATPVGSAAQPLPPAASQRPGLLSDEGVAVFERLLGAARVPQVVVSVQPLSEVIEQSNRFTTDAVLAKLDRLADRPLQQRPQLASAFSAPESELEQQIAQVWQRVLGIERVGVHDNFFELGGTSLSGIQMTAELKKLLQIDIPTVIIFEAPTVRALVHYLNPERDGPAALQNSRDRAERKLARKRKR